MAAAVLCLAQAPNASATIDAGDVFGATLVQGTDDVPFGEFGGGYISCDPGQRALTGGAFWHGTGMDPSPGIADQGYLANSSVTGDAKGWYADGFHRSGAGPLSLTEDVRCLPKAKLTGGELREKTVSASGFSDAHAHAKCPAGTRVTTGGAFFHKKGLGPDPDTGGGSRSSASFATKNGTGWYANGSSGLGKKGRLTVFARCLPKHRLGHIEVVTVTRTFAPNTNDGGYDSCPLNTAALTGGVYWLAPGKDLNHSIGAGVISSSSVTFDAKGWYTAGQSDDVADMTTVIHCVGS